MNALASRVRRNAYFMLGMGAIILLIGAHLIDLNTGLTNLVAKLEWQVVTGLFLVCILGFQWGLFYHKIAKNMSVIPRHQKLHKFAGVGFIIIFALHTDRVGYAWTMVLTVVLAGLLLTGLFNREIISYRPQWLYRAWLWLHISFASILMPLVIVHIFVALAFE